MTVLPRDSARVKAIPTPPPRTAGVPPISPHSQTWSGKAPVSAAPTRCCSSATPAGGWSGLSGATGPYAGMARWGAWSVKAPPLLWFRRNHPHRGLAAGRPCLRVPVQVPGHGAGTAGEAVSGPGLDGQPVEVALHYGTRAGRRRVDEAKATLAQQ